MNTLIVGKLERDASYRVMTATSIKEWSNANDSGNTKVVKFIPESTDPNNYQADDHRKILNNARI